MLNIGIKIASWRYKYALRHSISTKDGKTVVTRGSLSKVPPNASFVDGVATKDCIIDPITALSIRIFIPQQCLGTDNNTGNKAFSWLPECTVLADDLTSDFKTFSEASDGSSVSSGCGSCEYDKLDDFLKFGGAYCPRKEIHQVKLPLIIQFHDGAFVNGSKDSVSNDVFCRRIAKACKSIVIAVDYRLAPEYKYPCAQDDGISVLKWLSKQASLAEFSLLDESRHFPHGLVESFGHMVVDPWVSAHVDFSRCALLGVGAGGNIAEQVSRVFVRSSLELDPVKIIGQILVCPLFGGVTQYPSEVLLANAHFMDRDTLALVWKLLLPEGEYHLDHPAIDPLLPSQIPLLGKTPSTLVITAELDMLRDRAAAYVEALKRAHVDATLVTFRNAVHGFATVDCLLDTKPAQACVEDIAIWFGKHIKQDYWG